MKSKFIKVSALMGVAATLVGLAGCANVQAQNMEAASNIILEESATWDEIAIFDAFNECHKFEVVDGVFGNWGTNSSNCLEKEQRLQTVAIRVSKQLQEIGDVQEQDLLTETQSALNALADASICGKFDDWHSSGPDDCGSKLRARVDAYEAVNRVIPKWYSIGKN